MESHSNRNKTERFLLRPAQIFFDYKSEVKMGKDLRTRYFWNLKQVKGNIFIFGLEILPVS